MVFHSYVGLPSKLTMAVAGPGLNKTPLIAFGVASCGWFGAGVRKKKSTSKNRVKQSLRKAISGWWFGTSILFSQKYWEFHHPNWRTHIFQRGGPTTNQCLSHDGCSVASSKHQLVQDSSHPPTKIPWEWTDFFPEIFPRWKPWQPGIPNSSLVSYGKSNPKKWMIRES